MVLLPIGNRNYGFTNARPAGRVFAVTGDYAAIARNHCAATMLTNAVAMLCPESLHRSFAEIHRVIGNGPVLRLARPANRYLQQAGVPYICEQYDRHLTEGSPERLAGIAREELLAGRPAALLVAASSLRWHWVLALPGEESGEALLISDSWHARQVFQYVPDRGSRLMGVCVFHPRAI